MENREKITNILPFDRVLIYLRTSNVAERGISHQEQEDACRKLLDQHDYTSIAIFEEDDRSENRN